MKRIFAYARVSIAGQNTLESQILEIREAGFRVEPRNVVQEVISGSTANGLREAFRNLTAKLQAGDSLVVTKLDGLGRDVIDVTTCIANLGRREIHVHCLALGKEDLTAAAGAAKMEVLHAVASFERDLLTERTHTGLAQARSDGKQLGRPKALNEELKLKIRNLLDSGQSVSSLARQFHTSRRTIMRQKAEFGNRFEELINAEKLESEDRTEDSENFFNKLKKLNPKK